MKTAPAISLHVVRATPEARHCNLPIAVGGAKLSLGVTRTRWMFQFSRRAMLRGSASLAATCVGFEPLAAGVTSGVAALGPQSLPAEASPKLSAEPPRVALASYGPAAGEPFPVPAAPLSRIHPAYLRTRVVYTRGERPGTIVIDPRARFLYFVEGGRTAIRYGVGVGRQGFSWSGIATVGDKQEWPDCYPPKEMIARRPELMRQLAELQSGLGVRAVRATRSARALSISGRTTRTPNTASTAPTSPGPSAATSPLAASA